MKSLFVSTVLIKGKADIVKLVIVFAALNFIYSVNKYSLSASQVPGTVQGTTMCKQYTVLPLQFCWKK